MTASLCGTWDMVSNVNFDGYMVALGISPALRKTAAKLKQKKVIKKQGDDLYCEGQVCRQVFKRKESG
ncbi:hypothetical protein NHX12_013062 [Muraenolepis orangiensis]|uniref:Cytosolic fatty-acid binding proteins domain-containing protein n=1 Tax=Muraenolepis orangiensis TaxID=630683 RepID=A0A9Q0DFF7_9TELE|nr:hypothetical protein NHX12_013062 [Muraenolepis orangiensis]